MSYHDERLSILLGQTFDVGWADLAIRQFLIERPPMEYVNNNLPRMGKNILGELEEVQEEALKIGMAEYDTAAHQAEVGDVFFFLLGALKAAQLPLDTTRLQQNVNGYGRHSNIHEQMIEVAGNMDQIRPEADLYHLLHLVTSYSATLPNSFDFKKTMQTVINKDKKNYPRVCFPGLDRVTGKVFSPDKLQSVYDHSRRSLKEIRRRHKNACAHYDPTAGLLPEHYLPYLPQILDYQHPTQAFQILCQNLPTGV